MAERDARAAEAQRRTGTPHIEPCSPEGNAFTRPELAEFWQLVKSSATSEAARVRVQGRFGNPPWVFDGCLAGREKHRVVIHYGRIDPFNSSIGLERVEFLVEIAQPAAWYGRRNVIVDLNP